jgi:hypothetical protein
MRTEDLTHCYGYLHERRGPSRSRRVSAGAPQPQRPPTQPPMLIGRRLTPTALLACAVAAALVPAMPANAASLTQFVSLAQRIAAATATAESGSNACAVIQPFYWEIGNRNGALASGSVPNVPAPAYTAATSMSIASASKWLYAAYVVQKQSGVLSASDIKYLTFRSGYVSFDNCPAWQTVDGCLNWQNNGDYTPGEDGMFHYGGGHMQKHASLIGLGALHSAELAAELQIQLGADVGFSYSRPQPAGGMVTTTSDYARFLRKLLDGQLRISKRLGSNAMCTNPATCAQASYTPIPATEHWQYSLGHWVESDPVVGDGAYSSPGAFGFYPWVNASQRWYGIVARRDASPGSTFESVQCGRLVRKAWATGMAQ